MAYELKINCGAYNIIIEGKDRDVFNQVKEVPEVEDKEILATALLEFLPPEGLLSVSRKTADGNFCDGPDGEPGYQKFNPAKAVAQSELVGGEMKESNQLFVVEERHYKEGKLNDTPGGTPAVQQFSVSTGQLILKKHYQDGLLNNKPDGEAAHQEFDDSGKPIARYFYLADVRNDGPNGEPASWEFNTDTGKTKIWHRKNGKKNDLPDGTPAYQIFNKADKLVRAEFCNDDKQQDPPDGTPAVLEFNGYDGSLTDAWRYKDDEQLKGLRRHARKKVEKPRRSGAQETASVEGKNHGIRISDKLRHLQRHHRRQKPRCFRASKSGTGSGGQGSPHHRSS